MRVPALNALVAGVALAAMAPGAALAVPLFGVNLVTNGTAEADVGSTGGVIPSVTGFSTTGTFTVVQYGAPGGFPALADPGPASRGLNFFAGGTNAPSSIGTQTIDLSSAAGAIDLGSVGVDLSGYLGGFSSQRDNAAFTVSFLGAGNVTLGSLSVGPVSNVDRNDATGLLLREATGTVPVGTRFAQLSLQFSRADGTYNDGYADNLSFVLTAVPEPSIPLLMGAGLLALALAGRAHSCRNASIGSSRAARRAGK